MISGSTKVVGLLGWPVEHTLSPVIQNAAFQAAGIDYVYVPLPVKPDELSKAVTGLKALGFAGVNVTVPHKVNILPYLDVIDRSAELVSAVNTVVFSGGQAIGYNTDMTGIVNSLLAANIVLAGKRAVLLGAGGAARAVAYGLLENGAATVTVGARDALKAEAFAASLHQGRMVNGCGWEQAAFNEALSSCDILVNCTPIGMYPQTTEEIPLKWSLMKRELVACDLIYNPVETRFLARAKDRGYKTVGGAGMLIEQGVAAFRLWTGLEAPKTVMYQALTEILAAPNRQ